MIKLEQARSLVGKLNLIRFALVSASMAFSLPIAALALRPQTAMAVAARSGSITSQEAYNNMVGLGAGKYRALALSYIFDPESVNVTQFSLTIQYDPLKYVFDQAHSGPLGAFSVGGDAPPPNPGIGTQPMQLLPSTGYQPGAPLPGSTLNYTNVGGLLTVDYVLGSPVTVTDNVNFFRLDLAYITPVENVDLSNSTVTYHASGPGADSTEVSFSCLTSGGENACGSPNPSTGVTINYAFVPEPSTAALFMLVMLGSIVPNRHRKKELLNSTVFGSATDHALE
jgi:hypothetical protein